MDLVASWLRATPLITEKRSFQSKLQKKKSYVIKGVWIVKKLFCTFKKLLLMFSWLVKDLLTSEKWSNWWVNFPDKCLLISETNTDAFLAYYGKLCIMNSFLFNCSFSSTVIGEKSKLTSFFFFSFMSSFFKSHNAAAAIANNTFYVSSTFHPESSPKCYLDY